MAKKSCKKGYYWCRTDEKCKKIPKGWHVMPTGFLMRDNEHKDEEKEETKKKNGNGTNGNGNGNGDSSGSSDGGGVSEGWSAKYKRSIDCDNPKGFSQRAHCQGRKKVNEAKEKGDHEVSMAQSQLKKSERNIAKLRKALGKKERNIPAWVQAKITDTEHNTDAAAGYMDVGEETCPICNEDPCQCLEGTLNEGRRDGKSAKDKDYSLHDWFKGGGWVQAGGKYDGKPCAKQPGQKTKPFCRDADDRASMSKKERSRRAAKKRKEDPNPNKKGKAKMVSASYSNWRADLQQLDEFLGGKPGDGYIGHPNLDIKNPFAKKQTKKEVLPNSQGGGLIQRNAAGLGDARMRQDAEIRRLLGQSYEFEGELVEDNKVKTRGGASDRIDIEFEGGTKQTIIPGKTKITSPGARPRPRQIFGVDKIGLEGPENPLGEEKDACYKKVKARYDVWPSAYASGALVKCRKVGAANWGNKTKKEGYEFSNWRDDFKATEYESVDIIKTEPLQPSKGIGSDMLGEKCWDGYVQKGMKKKGKKVVPNCVKEEEKKVKRWWDDDGDGIGWEEGEVKKPKKKKKTRKEGFSNWREELSEKYAGQYDKGMPGSKPYGGRETGPVQDPNYLYDRIENIRKSIPVKKASAKKTIQVAHFEPEGELIEDWQKVNKGDKTDGMSQKAVDAYKRENPGSKLKTAVTEKNPGGKRAKRRKSFCARSNGQRKMHNIDCSKTPDKAICKARKRWRC